MKLEFAASAGGDAIAGTLPHTVRGECERLREVMLCAPTHLSAVPCCSVTRESLRRGFAPSIPRALDQHAALRVALRRCGVVCHELPALPGLADLCFTRDVAVTTPWGLTILNPAAPHRAQEAGHLAQWAGEPATRVDAGTIEGGDICIVRPGLLIVGVSGERTTQAGADAFAARFIEKGWDVLFYPFDPHFLHLDTIFCMLTPDRALACVEVLDDVFLQAIAERGIRVLPVTYKEARRLGCNVLSIDGKSIIAAAGTPRVAAMMRTDGFEVIEVDVSQFAACGGGIHCLTMPLRRG